VEEAEEVDEVDCEVAPSMILLSSLLKLLAIEIDRPTTDPAIPRPRTTKANVAAFDIMINSLMGLRMEAPRGLVPLGFGD